MSELNAQLVIASKVKSDLASIDIDNESIKAYFIEKYAPGATDIELVEFISTAIADEARPGEDIYFLKFKKREGGYYPATIVHSINWMCRKANESGDFVGFTDPEYQGPDGKWVKLWLPKNAAPMACRIGVIKKGTALIGYSTVRWDERFKDQGEWKNQPIHMLTKCAKAQALRDGGFKGCRGYVREEMIHHDPGEWTDDPNKSKVQNAIDAGRAAKDRHTERAALQNGDLKPEKITPDQAGKLKDLWEILDYDADMRVKFTMREIGKSKGFTAGDADRMIAVLEAELRAKDSQDAGEA